MNTNRFFPRIAVAVFALAASLNMRASTALAGNPDTAGLPPRTLIRRPADRPVPEIGLRTHVRIGHLPGYNDRMVKEFVKAGYNVITVNCLIHWDRVGPSASMYTPEQVKESDVYLHRVVDTIQAGGAKAIMYIGPVQVPYFSKSFVKAHPDWVKTGTDGKAQEPAVFGNIRGGYADWLCDQLAYVVKTYKADGFWFDGFAPGHLHAYDPKTKQLFKDISGGKDIPLNLNPVKNPIARQYLPWHEQYFVDFADRMRGAIRKENPGAVIFVNHSGNRTWYFPNMYMGEYSGAYSSAVDVSSIELYWDVPGDALYQQFCYAFMQGQTRERGASVWMQPTAHGISGVAAPIEIQLRGLEGPPWGVYPEFIEAAGREDFHKVHAANVKAREEWWKKSEAIPYVGVVASEQTRTLYAQGALPVYFSHTLGAFKAIFEKHWPVRVLSEYDLEDADLQGVRVLVLPNVASMSARAAEVVRRFVHQGGGLVASFETSLYDENYQRRGDFALADLFQAHYAKTHAVSMRSEQLQLKVTENHPIVDDPLIRAEQNTGWMGGEGPPPESGNLALIASAVDVKPDSHGQVVATYQMSPPNANTSHPAIIASTHGKGRVVYFPAGIDKGMFFYPSGYMRQMLANACRWAANDVPPPIEVSGPLVLAATFRRQPEQKRFIVHLLNDHSSYGRHSTYQKLAALPEELQKQWGFPNQSELRGTWPIREEVIPLHDIQVICRQPGVSKATLQPENQPLALTRRADGVHVTVPKLYMHSMVVFE